MATGSCLTNKVLLRNGIRETSAITKVRAVVDEVEELAISRLKTLFGPRAWDPSTDVHVNVQPYSGSPANLAVYLAFCNCGRHGDGLGPPRRR